MRVSVRMSRWLAGCAAVALLGGSGCRRSSREAAKPALAASSARNEQALTVPSLEPAVGEPPPPQWSEPLWQQAAEGDPLDEARLAQREGVTGLMAGFEQGGVVGLAALRALRFAPDRLEALPRLCSLLVHSHGNARLAIAAAASGAVRGLHSGEWTDPRGRQTCRDALAQLAEASGPAEERDRLAELAQALDELAPPAPSAP